jgi:hypothetical protein
MNQAEIDAEMTTAVPADSLRALQEYAQAHDQVTNHGNTEIEKVAQNLA